MKFTKILLFLLAVLCVGQAAAEPIEVTNPNNVLYKYYRQWRDYRLIERLPPVMPYPLQVHESLLKEVVNNPRSPKAERDIAREFLQHIQPDTAGVSFIDFKFTAVPMYASKTEDSSVRLPNLHGEGGLGFEAGGYLSENISVAAHYLAFAKDALHPDPQIDTFEDDADITLAGRQIDLRQSYQTIAAVGSSSLWFQSGISRVSAGPLYDTNPVLSGQAMNLPEFSLTWNTKHFSFTNTYMELTASNYVGEGAFAGKHMFLQTLQWQPPVEGLELSLYQTAVWGGRFDLLYFVPFSFLFYNQSLNGFQDNILLGGALRYDTGPGLSYKTVGYVDDADFNRLIRFDFGGKSKLVWENEVSWTPLHKWLRKVSLNYTIITPFMYSHLADRFDRANEFGSNDLTDVPDVPELWTEPQGYYDLVLSEEPNYQNYTHHGESLGVQMQPNSDRLSLEYISRPFEGFVVRGRGAYMRHGNALEDLKDSDYAFEYNPSQWAGESTIFDDGYSDDGQQAYNLGAGFLTQSVLEHSLTAELTLGYAWQRGAHQFGTAAAFVFSYIQNKNFNSGQTEQKFSVPLSFMYKYHIR